MIAFIWPRVLAAKATSQTTFQPYKALPLKSGSERLGTGVFNMRTSSRFPQCPPLHQKEEHRDQNEYVNRRRDHAADDGRRDRFHYIGTDTGLPQYRRQAEDYGRNRHQFRT